jgi:Outer membrane protein beta-barrel domain
VKAVVRLVCASLVGVSFFLPSAGAHAQVTATAPVTAAPEYNNRWEIYGGAQYSHFNPSPGPNIAANNLLGWNGTATVFLHTSWGLEAGARGLYGTMTIPTNPYGVPANPRMSENLFLFGPTLRIIRRENYAAGLHALVGAAYGSFDKDFPSGVQPDLVNIYNNKLAVGGAVGAWADYNLSSRLAVRVIADYQPTHYGFQSQSEFAGSVGIVYKFGALKK